ncbi:MAG: MarC family protein [Pannonibacter phragmitetus]|uniref:MarC family protein n=1 Tax=Pannonibacter indicus TaxID=466044 RepID=UPI0035AE135C
MVLIEFILNAFATLFVTIDPVGLAPMFLALTSGVSAADRRRVAVRATLTAGAILFVFFFSGQTVLNLLGISVPAFRVAGGLLLFAIAFEMVFDHRNKRKSETAEKAVVHSRQDLHALAVFPLSIPLIAGPAAISAVILLSSQAPDTATYAGVGGVILSILACCMGAFLLADKIERLMGDTVQMVVTRLLGVLLAALSIQFIADGVIAFANGAMAQ